MDGTRVLSQIEHNGFAINEQYLHHTIQEVKKRIEDIEQELMDTEVYQTWKKRFGDKSNIGSRQQLGTVLFKDLGYKSKIKTKTNRDATDEVALGKINHPFVRKYLYRAKLEKLKSTYLEGLAEEVINGRVHPVFNLHTIITFRSSADSPNIQNQYARNPEFSEIVRRCYVPSKGNRLVEVDYSAIEFRIAACFWHDERMVDYASDTSKDVHRDMAAECYSCDISEVSKLMRSIAKNRFVFPILYGSYYGNCAQDLWYAIRDFNLETKDGVPLRKHLRGKGIKKLGPCQHSMTPMPGTFEHHIKKIEKRFKDSFPTFRDGSEQWLDNFYKSGHFNMVTGFRVGGLLSKNDLLNYPIQGPAFHCLLWSLIRMQKWLNRNKKRSKLVAEIHDSMIFDAVEDEIQDILTQCKRVMTEEIRKHWKWIITPLDIEAEVTPVNGSWFDKEPWIEIDNQWKSKTIKTS
jgi:DNA polymerase-1